MAKYRLHELEAALVKRNPLMAETLRPPLSESEINALLKRGRVVGSVQPIIALYSWRNGTVFDERLRVSKTGFFPGEIYQLIDLQTAIEHMMGHKDAVFGPFPDLAGRYLPVFWNGSCNWMAIDLKGAGKNSVVLIRFFIREASFKDGHYEPEIPEKDPPPEAYPSFEDFLADAIRANRDNSPLACFQQK